MAIKLYYAARTRAARPRWMLEELGVPYELARIDLAKREHKTPEYLKVHPLGSVPAIQDDDLTLIESGAICMYLADKYIDRGFAPLPTSSDRAAYYQWCLFGSVTLDYCAVQTYFHTIFFPEHRRIPAVAAEGRQKFDDCAKVLETYLQDREYLVGNKMSTADVINGAVLALGNRLELLESYPVVKRYLENLKARPAYKRAFAD